MKSRFGSWAHFWVQLNDRRYGSVADMIGQPVPTSRNFVKGDIQEQREHNRHDGQANLGFAEELCRCVRTKGIAHGIRVSQVQKTFIRNRIASGLYRKPEIAEMEN